jgi:hypothetical protein
MASLAHGRRGQTLFAVALLAVIVTIGCGDSGTPLQPKPAPSGGSAGSEGPLSGSTSAGSAGTAPSDGARGGSGGHAGGEQAGAANAGGTAGESEGGAGGLSEEPELGRGALVATDSGTCALDARGEIQCWGLAPEEWSIPDGPFVELFGGAAVVCAVRADRSTTCFAQPSGSPSLAHVPMGFVQELAVGRGAICGVDSNSALFCKGANVQLMLTPPPGAFTKVSVGVQFGCAIRAAERGIECWPADNFGDCTYSPNAGQLAAPPGSFTALSSGAYHTCAVRDDGILQCWGLGKAGETLDDACFGGESFGQSEPPSGTFAAVAAGIYHSCAVRTDGALACWGAGTRDECEMGSLSCRQSLPPAGNFAQVAVGLAHSCAMTRARKIQCWGYDEGDDGRTAPPADFR